MTPAVAVLHRRLADPLGTLDIRTIWERQIQARLARIKSLLRRSLKHGLDVPVLRLQQTTGPRAGEVAREGAFANPVTGDAAFERYAEEISLQVLTEEEKAEDDISAAYYAVALFGTYRLGVGHALAVTRSPGRPDTLLNSTVHRQAVRALEQEAFDRIKGLSSDMAAQLRETMVDGLSRGLPADRIAVQVLMKVDGVGWNRARAIARMMVTKAHAEATLNVFQGVGIREVTGLVEFTLNVHGNAEPCPQCIALEGTRATIEQARGVIPVHPQCQCAWLPA